MSPEQLEKYVKFFNKINEILVKEGVQPISQASIANFCTDQNRNNTHEKAKELLEKEDKAKAIYKESKKATESKKDCGVAMLDRIVYTQMDLSDTEEANKKNVETVKNFQDVDYCFNYISNSMKNVINLDWEHELKENNSINKLVDSYDKNADLHNFAFVMGNFGGVKNENGYNPKLRDMFDKITLIQLLATSKSATAIAANKLYTILPDEAFSFNVVTTLVSHTKELENEFPEILQDMDLATELIGVANPCGDLDAKRGIAKAVNEGKMPPDMLTNYHYEKDGKKVPFINIYDLAQKGQSLDEYNLVKERPQTIERQKEALNEPLFGSKSEFSKEPLDKNLEIQCIIGEEIANVVNNALKSKGSKDFITNEDIANLVYDEKRQKQHEEAVKLVERKNKQLSLLSEIREQLGLEKKEGPEYRLLWSYIDVSGTEEARKHNEDIIKKASTPEGIREINNNAIKEIFNAKVEDIYSKEATFDSYLEHGKQNIDFLRRCFVVECMNGGNAFDYRFNDIMNTNAHFLEYQETQNAIEMMASPIFAMVPDKVFKDPDLCMALVTNMGKIIDVIKTNAPEYSIPQASADLSSTLTISKAMSDNMCRDLIKDGNLTMENLLKGEFVVEGKGKVGYDELEDVYSKGQKDKIKFVEYSKEKQRDIQEVLKGDVVVSRDKQREMLTEFFSDVISPKQNGNITDKLDSFKKTHSVFSRDTKQFKDMEKSLTKVAELTQKYNDPKNRELDKMAKLANELKEAIVDLNDKTTIYRDKKQKEKDTKKRFSSRSQDRLDIANDLLKLVDEVIGVHPTVTNNAPQRKPLDSEKSKKLDGDIKDKPIVQDKQKAKTEPVKETSLDK